MSPKVKPKKTPEPINDERVTNAAPTVDDLDSRSDEGTERGKRKGVYIPFTEDGQGVDYKRLRGDTSKLDDARRVLGVVEGMSATKASGLEVSEDFIKGLYSGFEFTLTRVGTLFLKWPQELAAEMHYSDDQKARLVPPTKAVLEKFAPVWLAKHQDIATLAVVLAAETGAMVQNALRAYVTKYPELVRADAVATQTVENKSENRVPTPIV